MHSPLTQPCTQPAQNRRFLSEVEGDRFGALKRFLKQEVDWNRVKSNMLYELVW